MPKQVFLMFFFFPQPILSLCDGDGRSQNKITSLAIWSNAWKAEEYNVVVIARWRILKQLLSQTYSGNWVGHTHEVNKAKH